MLPNCTNFTITSTFLAHSLKMLSDQNVNWFCSISNERKEYFKLFIWSEHTNKSIPSTAVDWPDTSRSGVVLAIRGVLESNSGDSDIAFALYGTDVAYGILSNRGWYIASDTTTSYSLFLRFFRVSVKGGTGKWWEFNQPSTSHVPDL